MNRIRGIVRVGLFLLGVMLQFAGFCVSQTEQAPWVLRIVSPKSVRGVLGVRTLGREEPLRPGDEGFREIGSTLMTRLVERYPNEDWNKVRVLKYEPEGKSTITGLGIELGGVKVSSFLSTGRQVMLRTDNLRSEFDKMRKRDIFRWSLGLFILGIAVVQVPLFLIESRPTVTHVTCKKRRDQEAETGNKPGRIE